MEKAIAKFGLTGRLIARGAEASVYEVEYWGCKAIAKVRETKRYRHPKVDEHLRLERTRNEALNMIRALKKGLPVPKLYNVYLRDATIIMEFVDGIPLREKVSVENIEKVGEVLAELHRINIAHWDYTTSNILVRGRDNEIVVIDFGLSRYTENILDKAVDLHLMIRSLMAVYGQREELIEALWRGYGRVGDIGAMKEAVERIERMGRYVKERRKTVW